MAHWQKAKKAKKAKAGRKAACCCEGSHNARQALPKSTPCKLKLRLPRRRTSCACFGCQSDVSEKNVQSACVMFNYVQGPEAQEAGFIQHL